MSVLSLSRFEDRDFVKGGAGSVGIRPQVISVGCLLILSLCATTTTTYSVGKKKIPEKKKLSISTTSRTETVLLLWCACACLCERWSLNLFSPTTKPLDTRQPLPIKSPQRKHRERKLQTPRRPDPLVSSVGLYTFRTCDAARRVSICIFVPLKQVNWVPAQHARDSRFAIAHFTHKWHLCGFRPHAKKIQHQTKLYHLLLICMDEYKHV